jgi:hypothetical protein
LVVSEAIQRGVVVMRVAYVVRATPQLLAP